MVCDEKATSMYRLIQLTQNILIITKTINVLENICFA